MPPNLLVKAAFVRGELDSMGNSDCEGKELIRTDFILQNIYHYVLRNRYEFHVMCAKNKKEEYVLRVLKETLNSFVASYGDNIKGLCLELDVTEDIIGSVIIGVSNELFSEGISWSRIIALFVFVGEFTVLCLSRKFPGRVVDRIYESFCKLVKEKLKTWVDDHGGWEGVTMLAVPHPESTNTLESPKSSNSGWAKSLLYSTIRMVGTLAQIANSSSHSLP